MRTLFDPRQEILAPLPQRTDPHGFPDFAVFRCFGWKIAPERAAVKLYRGRESTFFSARAQF